MINAPPVMFLMSEGRGHLFFIIIIDAQNKLQTMQFVMINRYQ